MATTVLASLCATVCLAAVPEPDFPDPHSLVLEIQRLKNHIARANSPADISQLPDSWHLRSEGREYWISTEPLRKMISSPTVAEHWLDDLSEQLEPLQPASPSSHAARDRLNRILSRREFRSRSEKSDAVANIFDAISSWIRNLVGRSLAGGPESGASRFIGWSVLLAGACLIIWLASRLIKRFSRTGPAPQVSSIESHPAEIDWLAVADAAAQSGDFRTAIHAEYWACVSRLQQSGNLPADPTRTPRELLSSIAPASEYTLFSNLTREFERFWYADALAAQDDFRRAASYAEALGCKAI